MSDLSHLKVDDQKRPRHLDDDVRLRWVPPFEGRYAVTDDGRVFSWARGWSTPSGARELSLAVQHRRSGHHRVQIYVDGESWYKGVHQFVLRAFVGPRPSPKHETRHLNGVPCDNRPENLKWGTAAENKADMKRNGYKFFGEHAPSAKLTWDEVDEIRRLYDSGEMYQTELAEKFNISQSQVSNIVRRASFKPEKRPDDGRERV